MLLKNYALSHNSIARSIYIRLLKLCTFATRRHSLQCGTEFAANLFKYSSVHLYLIFVWANVMKESNMMKEYAGTYKLYNKEDTKTMSFF